MVRQPAEVVIERLKPGLAHAIEHGAGHRGIERRKTEDVEAQYRETFARLAAQQDAEIDLARAALLVCRMAYPELDEGHYLGEMERLGTLARERSGGHDGFAAAAAVARFLFEESGFRGNAEDYYDPRNSYLSDVLDRRLGIPITLSLVLMEVGRRAGVSFRGVGFPGHFIVKVVDAGEQFFFDPFSGGRTVSESELADRVSAAGSHERLHQHLAAVTKRQMLARLVGNLKFTYLESQQFEYALDAVNLLLALTPWDLDQIKDRGLIGYRLNQYERSYEDLRTYVAYRPDAQDVEWIAKMARTVRQLSHEQGAV